MDASVHQEVDGILETASGIRFDVFKPRYCDIRINDIAHHLSHQCRFSGACKEFYSVAQHCVYVSDWATVSLEQSKNWPADDIRQMALGCLLHDAAEAYLVDLPRPVKNLAGDYRRTEERLQREIYERYHLYLSDDARRLIHRFDGEMLAAEAFQLMPSKGSWWSDRAKPASIKIHPLCPNQAKSLFLSRFLELKGS